MNRDALFCDGTGSYVIPPEPNEEETIDLLFRTAASDVDCVELYTDGNYYEMKKTDTGSVFDYYRISWKLGTDMMKYSFRVTSGDEVVYFNRFGVTDKWIEMYDFRITPGFTTPNWAKGAVMYQIFTDRFCNGDPSNDVLEREYSYIHESVRKVDDWNHYPEAMDVRNFYGGDLQGVWDKLDYLQDLGVEVIYFNPLFVSPSNHKYDIQDYDYIDPHFGVIREDAGDVLAEGDLDNRHATRYQSRVTNWENLEASNEFFAQLVAEIHRRGMKVILDGVFNHCGSFNKWMDREQIYEGKDGYQPGAYVSADSPYHTFFDFRGAGPEQWPYNGNYDGWWGHDTLPKLDYEHSEALEKYILHIARKWVSEPYNVDGWRLDVAADLGHSNEYNHEFWKKFRKTVKEANPDALILAEHYGDPAEWLDGEEWDSVMNYDAFMEPVTWFLTGMEKHSDEYRGDLLGNADNFVNAMKHHMANMMTPSLQTAMNQLSNHDHSRFLTRTNHKVGRVGQLGSRAAEEGVSLAVMREAIIMQMTWPGAPTLYYGDEAGLCGFTDPDNRRTYPWGREKRDLINFYREMIQIHRKSLALRKGSIKMLKAEPDLLAYGRFWGNEQIVVIINNSDHLKEVRVPVWQAEVAEGHNMARVMYSYEDGYIGEFEEYIVKDGNISLMMGKKSAIVLKNKKW